MGQRRGGGVGGVLFIGTVFRAKENPKQNKETPHLVDESDNGIYGEDGEDGDDENDEDEEDEEEEDRMGEGRGDRDGSETKPRIMARPRPLTALETQRQVKEMPPATSFFVFSQTNRLDGCS